MNSVQIRSYFWSVFSCIHSEYRKIQTRNNSVFGHFSRNGVAVDPLSNRTKFSKSPEWFDIFSSYSDLKSNILSNISPHPRLESDPYGYAQILIL